jgi:hypothetical protein
MKNRTAPTSAQLSPGWAEHHVPAPGSQRAYTPKPVDFDDSREGDFGHEPGQASLNSIKLASRREQSRLERSYR